MNEPNKSKIEELKKKLYDPNYEMKDNFREGVLHEIRHEVKEDWEGDEDDMKNKKRKPKMSIFKKFFIVSVGFFIVALGYSAYNFLLEDTSVSSNKIEIQVIGNSFTKGGDELPLQIEITNKNTASLELAALIVEYPKGADDDSEVVRLNRDQIGVIKPGESVIRNIKVKLYGSEKSVRNIKINLEYHPEGSNAVFSKEVLYPITISLAPISLDIQGPSSTTPDQLVTFKISTKLNTTLPDTNPILQVTYPNGFRLEKSTVPPYLGNSVWDLSSLSLTNPIDIEITGSMSGQEGDEQILHAYVGTSNGSDLSKVNVVYSSVLQKVSIVKPFLDAKILVNSQDLPEYAVTSGSEVKVKISWTNNLSSVLTDGEIRASLSGNVFDKNEVDPEGGYYDSINSQVIWNKTTTREFANIAPGATGQVSFSFTPKSLLGLSNSVSNPQVTIKVSIKGQQPLLGNTYSGIDNFSEKTVKIMSDFQIATSASYFSGSLPPKAETETNYMITWTLSNTTNSMNQAVAVASLPLSVDWVGVIAGTKEDVSYNSLSREIIWNIGSVLPNTGINVNKEVSFVVSLKPSINQIGKLPVLIEGVSLSGIDNFTNAVIKSTKGSTNTSSGGVNPGGGVVIP